MELEELPIPISLQPTIFIQNAIIKLHEGCVPSFAEVLFQNQVFCSREGVKKLAEEIVITTRIRRNSIPIMTALTKKLLTNNHFSELRDFLLTRIFIESTYLFLLSLLNDGVFTKKEISEKIISNKRYDFALFFSKEIDIPDKNGWHLPIKFRSIQENIENLKENNWFLFDQLRNLGWENDSIGAIIKLDDVDALTELSSRHNFFIGGFVEASPFEPMNVPRVTTYISLAAFFGSVKCFKFLLLSGAKLTENVMNCAVAGGCFEIVRIISQHNIKGGIEAAIEFRRNDMINWIRKSQTISDISESACLDWKNTLAALYFSIENGTTKKLTEAVQEFMQGQTTLMYDVINTTPLSSF